MIALGWGRSPLPFDPPRGAEVLAQRVPPPVVDLDATLDAALARPFGAAPLGRRVPADARVLVVVSDASREEPRAALFAAARRALAHVPDDRVTIAVANGTHAPGPPAALLPAEVLARHRVVNHDARDLASLVEAGRTARGTRVRVNRCVAESDLVVVTGRVKPHYFAGWGGGAKGIFPGLGENADIRQNHLLKADPASSLGRADGNPCREDIEEAVAIALGGREGHLLDVVEAGGSVFGAVAGDLVAAHRAAVALARPWCEARAAKADVVVVSAPAPVTTSLYQASKLVPPAGMLLREGGVVVVVAECADGVGPLEVVNEGIFRLGVRRFLPERYRLLLVSAMPEATVRRTYAEFAPSLEAAVAEARRTADDGARWLVLPDAGDLVPCPIG
jgi:nickel-dependent lactate racemase